MDEAFEAFEEKTENNFKVAEQAIRAHTKFLNELDARITYEELITHVVLHDLEI